MRNVRSHVRIDGRVQGVCFRMDARRAALERNLTGWVKNLPDGGVEAVFEGAEADVKSMLKWCEIGPPLAQVRKTTAEWEAYNGEFDTFEITFT